MVELSIPIKEGLTMFMVYIRFNGRRIGQKIVSAQTLEHAVANARFEYIACNDIAFEEVHLVDVWGHKV